MSLSICPQFFSGIVIRNFLIFLHRDRVKSFGAFFCFLALRCNNVNCCFVVFGPKWVFWSFFGKLSSRIFLIFCIKFYQHMNFVGKHLILRFWGKNEVFQVLSNVSFQVLSNVSAWKCTDFVYQVTQHKGFKLNEKTLFWNKFCLFEKLEIFLWKINAWNFSDFLNGVTIGKRFKIYSNDFFGGESCTRILDQKWPIMRGFL